MRGRSIGSSLSVREFSVLHQVDTIGECDAGTAVISAAGCDAEGHNKQFAKRGGPHFVNLKRPSRSKPFIRVTHNRSELRRIIPSLPDSLKAAHSHSESQSR